jgi:hypothetical protein
MRMLPPTLLAISPTAPFGGALPIDSRFGMTHGH